MNDRRLVYVPESFSTKSPEDASPSRSGATKPVRERINKFITRVRVNTPYASQETIDANPPGTNVTVSCNRSIAKPPAATTQITCAAKGLYEARGTQVEQHGCAAYSFTVIPYLLISLLNFLAMICEPQYPALYLVELDKSPGPQNTVATRPGDSENAQTHDSSQEGGLEGPLDDRQEVVTGAIGTICPPGARNKAATGPGDSENAQTHGSFKEGGLEGPLTDQHEEVTGAIGTVYLPGQCEGLSGNWKSRVIPVLTSGSQ